MNVETETFLADDGIRLVGDVWRAGDGGDGRAPVLLMHGGGQTRHSWAGAAERFARAGRTAITMDARGHGESDRSPGGDYGWARISGDVLTLADRIAERFGAVPVPVGASMGGLATMAAETERPGTFPAAVLVDITPRMRMDGVERILGFMAANAEAGFDTVEAAADAIAAYLPHRPRPKSLDGLSKNLRQGDDGRFYWHWDPAFVAAMQSREEGRPDRLAHLESGVRAMRQPILLVRGRQSELVTQEEVDHFLSLAPHAKVTDVSGAGHMVAGDRNDIFADEVIAFLDGL